MPRNRQQTESRIRDAAVGILRTVGFAGWGINAVARAAGFDKVLVYRYFDSLDGLLEEIAGSCDYWPDPAGLPVSSPEAYFEATLQWIRGRPEIPVLLSHPPFLAQASPAGRKFNADLDRWLECLSQNCRGSIGRDPLLRLPALLLLASTGRIAFSPHSLWQQVSPPLEWSGSHDDGGWEDLPPELL